jgi:hypothetical protein
MRALWIDAGNDPHWAKMDQFDTLYFALNDPRVTKQYLQGVASKGFGVGVYVVTNWAGFNQPSGANFANAVADKVNTLRMSNVSPRVQLDAEQHDPQFIIDMVTQWRKRLPYQATSWTMEAMQGGWMTDEMVAAVLAARIRVVPQAYTGDMRPIAQDAALRDLLRRGFPETSISLFYDAAALPLEWAGFAFTMGRLP